MAVVTTEQGTDDWNTVAECLHKLYPSTQRSGKQCRERWHNHLHPTVNKGEWTAEERRVLFEYQRQFGNKWREIADLLPGRSDNAIKNYFYSTLRRNLRQYNKARPHSERIHGSSRTLLRNPAVVEILLDMETPARPVTVRKPVHRQEKLSEPARKPRAQEVELEQKEPKLELEEESDDGVNLLVKLWEDTNAWVMPKAYLVKPTVSGQFIVGKPPSPHK